MTILANLTTGTGDGSVTLGVDAFGSFGLDIDSPESSDPQYDPVGAQLGVGTTFRSQVAIRSGSNVPRTFLNDALIVNPIITNPTPTTAQSTFSVDGLNFELTQKVTELIVDGEKKGSLLTQTYIITNPTTALVDFELVRYIDGDLDFDGSIQDAGGRKVSGTEEILLETDSGTDPSVEGTFLGITGIGGSTASPGRYEIDDYSVLRSNIVAGTALDDSISGDSPDADQFIDIAPYDLALALRNTFSLLPGQSTEYTTTTIFGTLPPNEVVVALPIIQIAAVGGVAEAGTIPGTFRITRLGSGTSSELINFNVAGSATFNTDYTASSTVPNLLFGANNGTILFPAGSTSVDITITPIDDNIFDPQEDIQLTVAPSAK